MIFKIYNKISPPTYKRISVDYSFPKFSGTKYSSGTIWNSESNSNALTSFKFLREVRSKLYGDCWGNDNVTSYHRIFHQNSHRKTLPVSSSTPVSDLLTGSRPRALESVELLRKVRPKLYGLSGSTSSEPLIILPQPNMGADPILTSATVQQGSCHSNHGGK
jgi:hypothetical protein